MSCCCLHDASWTSTAANCSTKRSGDGGSGVTCDERWLLLLSSLQAVEELAVTTPGLQTFGHYHLDSAAYQARLRSNDGLFGHEGLMTVARGLISPGSRRKAYTAAGPLVHEYLARGGGIDANEQELLDGPGYARLVLEANATAAGLVGQTGFVDGAYARLDDEYQGGGSGGRSWSTATARPNRPGIRLCRSDSGLRKRHRALSRSFPPPTTQSRRSSKPAIRDGESHSG